MSPWKITESDKKEEEETKDQEFTYQNPIPENLDIEILNFQTQQNLNLENPEIETPNFQMQHNQNNQNPNINNQHHLSPAIDLLPVDTPQQPLSQPLIQLLPQ
ncbi:hypothetical protein G9A89_016334 [Geosiphon pyriformis]|nr:hypothetical protein G9A89_016334 [Geosiphon pyriformis]